MASLHAGTGDVHVVDVRNDGTIPDLPADAVVEVPARIDASGAHPVALRPLAPELLGLVEHAKAYERLAVEASITGSRDAALKALLANPLVPSFAVAEPLLDALLEANRRFLPRFSPDRA
jgi:6-phospho-beta-glucosidase